MGRSRPIGLLASLVLLAVLIAIGLRSGPGPPQSDLRNGQVFIQDNLWSAGRYQYAVWVGPEGTPYAGRRPQGGGGWKIVNLAELPGNPLDAPTADDTHNVYAIGVDAEGNVHVAGNMKASPLRYARASANLDRWVTGPRPPTGDSVTYPAFTSLPNGTLLFWYQQGSLTPHASLRLDALYPGARKWRSLGPVLDGAPTGETPYPNHIAIDPRTGVINLMFEWRGTEDVSTTNDVGYARSSDGGRKWETADGTRLPRPIIHTSATTIIDTAPTGSGLVNSGGLALDPHGRPYGIVVFDEPGGGRAWEEAWFQRGTWQRRWLNDLDLDGRPQLAGTPDGRIWAIGARGDALEAVDVTPGRAPAPSRDIARVPLGWEANYDDRALARDGVVEMLIPEGDRPHVVEARLAGP